MYPTVDSGLTITSTWLRLAWFIMIPPSSDAADGLTRDDVDDVDGTVTCRIIIVVL